MGGGQVGGWVGDRWVSGWGTGGWVGGGQVGGWGMGGWSVGNSGLVCPRLIESVSI